MIGRIVFREIRAAWKILLMFCLLMIIYSAGIVAMFPFYRSSLTEELEGANRVNIELPNEPQGNITLTWDSLDNATGYMVLEDNRSSMLTAKIKYTGNETNITFQKDFTEKRYYAVMALLEGASDPVLVGIVTTEGSDPFKELLENPFYKSFTGGRSISMLEVKGFITLEFFMLWTILAGMFIAYISVSIVAGDFENRYMDILLSKPISRRQYLAEKFATMSIISLILALTASLGIITGLSYTNSLNELSPQTVLLSLVGGLPVLMVIAAVSILVAVKFQKIRTGMGISFAFVFAQLFMRTFGSFSRSLELMKAISIFEYWDYTSVVFDNVFKAADFIGLTIVSVLILIASILVFERKDIPI
jgi:ABC-2 type transport system permease protein